MPATVGFATGSGEPVPNASARDLFIRHCARCHGSDGTGGTDLGRKLEVPDIKAEGKNLSGAKIVRVIANGKAEMPGFAKTMSKKQIAAVAAYVRKL